MSEIPEWAKERAAEEINAAVVPAARVWRGEHITRNNNIALAFARYIAEHEEPPVDPLLIEARRVCTAQSGQTDFTDGSRDNWYVLQTALAALRRGIEIGKSNA